MGTTLVCGMIPILKGLPVGDRGLWPRVALFGAGLQTYSAHLWCCTTALSQCFHFLVESVLKSQPQPKNNINPFLLLLPSPHTLLPALLSASHNSTKRKINVSPWSIHPGLSSTCWPCCFTPSPGWDFRAAFTLLAPSPQTCGLGAGVFPSCMRGEATGEQCIPLSWAAPLLCEPCKAISADNSDPRQQSQ